MSNTRETVVGIFESESQARQVLDELIGIGVPRDDIHLSSASNTARDVASGGASLHGRQPEHHGGGFMGWLDSLFGADDADERTRYSGIVSQGRSVLAVDADEARRERVIDIMNSHGALDVDEDSRSYGSSGLRENTTTRNVSSASDVADRSGTEQAIPVVREELRVGKRAVQSGAVRVYSRIIEEPVEETVQLREEKIRVNRRPVNREVTAADEALLRDQSIELTQTVEEPVVQKQARVVEEVVVGKDVTERTETVRDTVRHTEVKTEDIASSAMGNYRDDFRRDFETRYKTSGDQFESYAPAYDYGYQMAGDTRYTGKRWEDVEDTLKTDFLRNNPTSSWDRTKGAVRYGWEKVTRKRP